NLEDKNMVGVINSATMQVEKTWSLAPGEEPSGIALDNDNHRLFIACSNKLMVIVDAESGSVVTTVPIGDRVDGEDFDAVLIRASRIESPRSPEAGESASPPENKTGFVCNS